MNRFSPNPTESRQWSELNHHWTDDDDDGDGADSDHDGSGWTPWSRTLRMNTVREKESVHFAVISYCEYAVVWFSVSRSFFLTLGDNVNALSEVRRLIWLLRFCCFMKWKKAKRRITPFWPGKYGNRAPRYRRVFRHKYRYQIGKGEIGIGTTFTFKQF